MPQFRLIVSVREDIGKPLQHMRNLPIEQIRKVREDNVHNVFVSKACMWRYRDGRQFCVGAPALPLCAVSPLRLPFSRSMVFPDYVINLIRYRNLLVLFD